METGAGSHAKKKDQTSTEGVTAIVDRVLRRLGWSWENAFEVRTVGREILHVTQCPEGYWRHKIRQAAREWTLRQAANRKAAKDLEKLDIQMDN